MIAIYARQSVEKKDSLSIEQQIDICRKTIASTGGTLESTLTPFEDKGYSGKNTDRPEFQKMLRQIEAGVISKVVVYKLDRISRSTLDFGSMMKTFQKHNVEFVSCSESFDTSNPMGKAMLQIAMVFAELERNTIQQRVKDNYYARGEKGFFMGGTTPYGLIKEGTTSQGKKTSTFSFDESKADVLRLMYDLYANTGYSLGMISDTLNKRGIPAPKGGGWDSGKISRIMHNPCYVRADADVYQYYKNRGCIVSNGIEDFGGTLACYLYGKREANERKYTDVKNHTLSLALHEGIIDSDIWLTCQRKLETNQQIKNTGKGQYTWLSGLIKCGKCGYTMTVIISNGKYKYFNCRGKTNYKVCVGQEKVAHVEEIETVVKSLIDDYFAKVNFEELADEQVTKKSLENNRIKTEIVKIEEQIENIIDKMGIMSSEAAKRLNEKITNLERQKKNLVDQMETIKSDQPKFRYDTIKDCISQWDSATLEQRKTVAAALIERVTINENNIGIVWRYWENQ